MPIVSSIILTDRVQADGRRRIVERHADHLGGLHDRRYTAEADDDVEAGLPASALFIENQLRQNEIDSSLRSIVEGTPVISLNHSTPAQIRDAMREQFRDARGIELANIAEFCLTLTNAQLQSLFNVGAGAPTTQLRARLQAKVDKRDALLAEVGE